jgi:hypothetical protein
MSNALDFWFLDKFVFRTYSSTWIAPFFTLTLITVPVVILSVFEASFIWNGGVGWLVILSYYFYFGKDIFLIFTSVTDPGTKTTLSKVEAVSIPPAR